MRIEVEAIVAAPLERVWAWWIDFGEPGSSFEVDHGNGKGTRTIRENDGKVVRFTDASPLAGALERRVDILDDHRLKDTGEGKRPFKSDWYFTDVGGSTRIVRTVGFRHPLVEMLGPIGRAITRRLVRKDLLAHVRQCERELAPRG